MRYKTCIISIAALAALLSINQPACAFLHPQLGRFLQRDPIGHADGMSSYQYERSTPAYRVDPRGTWSWQTSGPFFNWNPQTKVCEASFIHIKVPGWLDTHVPGAALIDLSSWFSSKGNQYTTAYPLNSVPKCSCSVDGLKGLLAGQNGAAAQNEIAKANGVDQGLTIGSNSSDVTASGMLMGGFSEVFGALEDAIGPSALDGVTIEGTVATKNQEAIDAGFSDVIYARDADGTKWTVFYNPSSGEYAGAHVSSGQ